ncbi:hypothetical protein FQA39_LY05198 [Lamprigera yunnana]|nr:hypothetical protein FQA39_LY05198 [Lamprigera yunnana]
MRWIIEIWSVEVYYYGFWGVIIEVLTIERKFDFNGNCVVNGELILENGITRIIEILENDYPIFFIALETLISKKKSAYWACSQVQLGVQAVFGPADPLLGAHIHSICDALDIPHLEARLDLDTDVREFSINLYPAQHLLNAAFQDIMNFLNWTKVAIIYEEDYGLIKLRELVRSPHNTDLEIHLRQADPESYRAVLKEIKNKDIHNLIIDTKPSNMQHFLKGVSIIFIMMLKKKMSMTVKLKNAFSSHFSRPEPYSERARN